MANWTIGEVTEEAAVRGWHPRGLWGQIRITVGDAVFFVSGYVRTWRFYAYGPGGFGIVYGETMDELNAKIANVEACIVAALADPIEDEAETDDADTYRTVGEPLGVGPGQSWY